LLDELLHKLYLLHVRALIFLFNLENQLIQVFINNTTLLTLYRFGIWNRRCVTCAL